MHILYQYYKNKNALTGCRKIFHNKYTQFKGMPNRYFKNNIVVVSYNITLLERPKISIVMYDP